MNKHPYAPGTIERHHRPLFTPAQRREMLRWLQLAFLAMSITGGTGLVAGLLAGWIFGGAQ